MKSDIMNKAIEEIKDTKCIREMCKQKPHLILKTQCGIGKYIFSNFSYKNNQLV